MQITQLGPYRVGKSIGRGGMGSVYEATDAETGQRVAIKALNPHLAQVEGFRERFEAEIESLKTLRHEGIVRLYGYGMQDGILFYSMEMIEGTSLEDELKAGRRFNWREATDIAIQLCRALKHAHDHGVIHRDIKPANILIANDERVKLADFGIARLFGSYSGLTSAGGVLGTADYMSPEQADGRPVTHRCDQYSLGGVMYALLAGRPPFRAKSLPEMLQLQRFAQPEPVSRFAHDTPQQLERVIAQLLSKDPADRFPNTQVLARHLQAMVRALSRPVSDSMSLATGSPELNLVDAELDRSLPLAVTQAEAEADVSPPPAVARSAVQSAAGPPMRTDGLETVPVEDRSRQVEFPPASVAGAAPVAASPESAAMPTGTATYTTVEEDAARQLQNQTHSRLTVLAPLFGLALAMAALASLATYLSRPLTADQLYVKITSQAGEEDANSLRNVESEIGEFLARFPDDQRASKLRQYQQHLDLDRAHRRLQLQARRAGVTDPDLLPVEALYLEAMSTAASSPESAVEMLESLVALYGADVPRDGAAPTGSQPTAAGRDGQSDSEERRQRCVQLAERQIELLHEKIAKQTEQQIAALRERMLVAAGISAGDPEDAGDMYRAIIRLYEHQPWAQEIVDEARGRLEQLSATAAPD
jgi:serine/threonine-protein kinase